MKTCFKCNQSLPLSEFYPHPKMSQGCLNKCKTCTKADTEARRKEKEKDPIWVLNEMERHRKKQERYRQLGKAVVLKGKKKTQVNKRYAINHPHVIKALSLAQHLKVKPCEKCGNPKAVRHHDDYSKPKKVRWLCKKHHKQYHDKIKEASVIARLA